MLKCQYMSQVAKCRNTPKLYTAGKDLYLTRGALQKFNSNIKRI